MVVPRQRTRRIDLPPGAARPRSSIDAAVLRAVLDHGPIARSSVARITGFSHASLTGVSARLIAGGLLREAPEAAGRPGAGRPSVPLEIDTRSSAVVGVHIAVPQLAGAVLDLRGRVLARIERAHVSTDPSTVVAQAAALVAELVGACVGDRRVLGVGVATGGWVDPDAGVVVAHQMLGWSDVPVRAMLEAAAGLPVWVDSHSRALLRAEQLFGRHVQRARSSMLQLFVGNVVDIAFATGEAVHLGPDSAAGIVAHMPLGDSTVACSCGRRGWFEASVSERRLLGRAAAAGLIRSPRLTDLLAAAEGGDTRALDLLVERAHAVGRGVGVLFDLYSPDLLVVAEAGINRFPECLAALHEAVESTSSVSAHQRVVRTSFPESVLHIAGGAVVIERVLSASLG